MNELIAKYVEGGSLTPDEITLLRSTVTRAKLEAFATGDAGRRGRARRFFKLSNLLFPNKARGKAKPAATQPATMFEQFRKLKSSHSPKIVSGGGANSTGHRS